MKNQILQTLKDLMQFETYEGNDEAFDKLFDYVKKNYKELNIEEYEFSGNKALVLSNTKSKKLDYIFCCHIDVVPAKTYKFTEDNINVYGRGAIDMKGSSSVCLNLMKNLKTNKKVALFLTSDEEVSGNCVYQLLKQYTSSLAIVPDGGKDFNLINEEKGLLQLELSIKTKSSHSAQLFNGVNAISELYNIYDKLIKIYPIPKSESEYITSINLSKIEGGVAYNQVPDMCKMILDIRYTSQDSVEQIIENIKKINKNVHINILLKGDIFKTDLNNKNIKRYIETCETVLKKKIQIRGCESTSDAIYFYEKSIPTIIMNPKGDFAHCDNEYVNKESLLKLYEIYQRFIEGSENI